MRKERTLLILGVWIISLPFLGFPESVRTIFAVLTGIALIYLSYIFYQEARAEMMKDQTKSNPFIDNVTQ